MLLCQNIFVMSPEGWEVIWKHESKKEMRNKEGERESTVEVLMTP